MPRRASSVRGDPGIRSSGWPPRPADLVAAEGAGAAAPRPPPRAAGRGVAGAGDGSPPARPGRAPSTGTPCPGSPSRLR